jgi:quinohemoprotein ethanol dehydrogenase
MLDGKQYIAVNAGWGGGLAHVESANYTDLHLGPPRLLVFKLGGKASLPPMPPRSATGEAAPAMLVTAPPTVIARGEQLFAQNCALCHGAAARGGIKDLRYMSTETHKAFLDIVLKGSRAANGMASFADVLSEDDAEAIHQYVNYRASIDRQ